MDEAYAAIRAHLERAGTSIGGNDLLIAAQARSLGLTLVTANLGAFSRVPDLATETWRSYTTPRDMGEERLPRS